MLPLFYAALFLAAGSNASPCKPSTSSSALAAAGSGEAATPGGGATSGGGAGATSGGGATPGGGVTPGGDATAGKKSAAQVAGSNNNLAGLTTPANSSGSGLVLPPLYSKSASVAGPSATGNIAPVSGGGSCPDGFINAVFNTNAPKNGGWPGTTWSSLSGNGVNSWVGFSLGPLNTKLTYGNPPVTPALNAAQFPLVMDSDDTDAAVELLQSANAPEYLGLFNEPDFSFENLTKVIDPEPAAQNLAKLFNTPHPKTTLISPALMNANNPKWLPIFKASCNGCFDQIPIIAQHLYHPDPDGALALIKQLHGTWPDKKIWLTELSPATSDCSLDATGIAGYINTLIPEIIKLGYVEKIFWNSGEWDAPAINGAPDKCNPSLTDANGNPTPILTALKNVCGGSGGTATA